VTNIWKGYLLVEQQVFKFSHENETVKIVEVTTYIKSFLRTGEAASSAKWLKKESEEKRTVSSLNKASKGEK